MQKVFLSSKRHLIVCVIAILGAAQRPAAADGLSLGPLFDDFPLTLSTGHRTEILGPIFYDEQNGTARTWAIPPLLAHLKDPATDSEEFDIGYPVLTYDRYGAEYRWQLIQLLSFSGGQDQQDRMSRRFTLFPLYFQQRSPDPARNYTAIFPLYGHLQNHLFRDDIFFVLFPLFGETRKKDVVTDNFLYPIFDLHHGNGMKGWQVWPLIGREHKDVTTETNGFGDVSTVAGHDNLFALWPLFLKEKSGIGTTNTENLLASLPLFSVVRSPARDSTTIIWPFFSHVTDRAKQYKEWELPWPLIIFARGEGKTTTRIWPFFSHAQNTNEESGFALWPIYKYNRLHGEGFERKRTRICFFLFSHTVQRNTETGRSEHRTDLWPLFTEKKDYNGNQRLQILSVLEPFIPTSKSIVRDYSPIWSLWRSEKNPEAQASSQSLLWNLYRRETSPAFKKYSLLFGLFQYQSGSEGRRVRLFYVPVAGTKSATGAGSP